MSVPRPFNLKVPIQILYFDGYYIFSPLVLKMRVLFQFLAGVFEQKTSDKKKATATMLELRS